MGQVVNMGASLMCPFGTAPSTLNVTSNQMVLVDGKPAATIQDSAAMANVPPFAMCTTLSNPQVASATAAALGVLTPQPCIPQCTGTWIATQGTVLIGGKPALTGDCSLMCAYGGKISITFPGQMMTLIS